jgi:hypothetical protein
MKSLSHVTLGLFFSQTLSWSGTLMAATDNDEVRSTLAGQTAVAVTIYNQDLALVKDRRRVELPAGRLDLAFRDVSAHIQPETALLRGLAPQAGLRLIEQNFDFDLLTPGKLLEKYVGRKVSVIRTHPTTGEDTAEVAEVLAASQGVVLRIGDRIETGMPGRIVYPEVPPNLRDRPTLVMHLENDLAGPQEVELSYLTGGLSWQADYVGELGAADNRLDLTGWVTLSNTSGTSYRDAHLQLVAGDVHRVEPAPMMRPMMEDARVMAAAPAPMAEEALFEYHLYTLEHPTSIADNQSKQVALLRATGIPVTKELLLRGSDYYYRRGAGDLGTKLKASVYLEFANTEAANLGMPLPKGTVRIYKADSAGNAQFVGEDEIDHTPKNEKVRLFLGEAFDVTADKKQTDFKKLSGFGPWQYQFESAYEILLKNAKPEPVTVRVEEPVPGDWEVIAESQPHEKGDAHTAVWQIEVPAEGQTALTYRVRVRF